jgi:hypothetical protein
MVKLYVKRPMPVEAVQWFKEGDHPKVWVSYLDKDTYHGFIETPEGLMKVVIGSWIVGPGYAGEYWSVKDDIFRNTYEEYTDE